MPAVSSPPSSAPKRPRCCASKKSTSRRIQPAHTLLPVRRKAAAATHSILLTSHTAFAPLQMDRQGVP
eukprot:4376787-Alexandrium_andersonii.AAC.1